MMRNGIAFIDLYLACARLGAIFVPINFRLDGHELAYILKNGPTQAFRIRQFILQKRVRTEPSQRNTPHAAGVSGRRTARKRVSFHLNPNQKNLTGKNPL